MTETTTLQTAPSITVSIPPRHGKNTFIFLFGSKLDHNELKTIIDNLNDGPPDDYYSIITTLPLSDCQAAPAHPRLLICSIAHHKIQHNGTTADITSQCKTTVADCIYGALKTINDDDPITPEGAHALTIVHPSIQLPNRALYQNLSSPTDLFSFALRFNSAHNTFTLVRFDDNDATGQPDPSLWQSHIQGLASPKDSHHIIIYTHHPMEQLQLLPPTIHEMLRQKAPNRHAIHSTVDGASQDYNGQIVHSPPNTQHSEAAAQFGSAAKTLAQIAAHLNAITAHFGEPITGDQANALARVAFAIIHNLTDPSTIIPPP